MKQFFKYVLATIVGLILFGFIFFVLMGGLVAKSITKEMKEDKVSISSNSILKLSFDLPVNDRPYETEGLASAFSLDNNENLGLRPILKAIEKAKTDPEIRGIYLDVDGVSTGFANLTELQDALKDFKTSDKFIISSSRLLTQKGYALASIADEVYLHPEGYFDFKGLAANVTFIKGTLDKLGIEPMIFYAGKFKSATEPLRRKNMSEPNKIQTKEFLEDIYGNYLEDISANRNIPVNELRDIADNMKIRTPEDALTFKMVDGVKYDDEVRAILRTRLGGDDDDDIEFVSLSDYSKARKITAKGKNVGSNRIAVLYAEGGINMGKDDNGRSINGDFYAKEIRKLRKNKSVKAVVLRVNSPGGSAFASDLMWRELELLKKEKPFIVSMGNYAASGGYYIACNSDKIYAEENTITGSIGVFGVLMNVQKTMEDKLGMTTDGVSTGKYSDFPNPTKQWSEAEKQIMQKQIDRIYDSFIGKVAEGRKLTKEQVNEIAQGRVWSGEDALKVGLVDEIGSLNDAIEYASKQAEVDNYKVSIYPEHKSSLDRFLEKLNIKTQAKAELKKELGTFAKTFDYLEAMESAQEPQMRIPYEMEIK